MGAKRCCADLGCGGLVVFSKGILESLIFGKDVIVSRGLSKGISESLIAAKDVIMIPVLSKGFVYVIVIKTIGSLVVIVKGMGFTVVIIVKTSCAL